MLKKFAAAAVALLSMGVSAHAADIKEIRVGLLGGENESDRLKNNACLADHLKADFGVDKVSLFPAADYDGVIQGLLGGTIDVAELGASGYAGVYLKDPKAVTPVLTTQAPDGSTGYYSIGLALKSLGLKSITDFKGKVLGYADPDSTSGYLIPLTQIPKTTGAANDKFFAKTQFNGGHENNLLAAYDGKVDVAVDDSSGLGDFKDGFTSGTFRKEVDKGAVDPSKLVADPERPDRLPHRPRRGFRCQARRRLQQHRRHRQEVHVGRRRRRLQGLRPGEARVLSGHHRRSQSHDRQVILSEGGAKSAALPLCGCCQCTTQSHQRRDARAGGTSVLPRRQCLGRGRSPARAGMAQRS